MLGCVVAEHEAERCITVTFLHPCIPAPSFVYPEQEDMLDVDVSDVLTCVTAITATGRTYKVGKREIQEACEELTTRLSKL